jgi:hypothetical protein
VRRRRPSEKCLQAAEAVFETASRLANGLADRLVLVHAAEGLDARAAEALATSGRVRFALGYRDDVRVIDNPPQAGLMDIVD